MNHLWKRGHVIHPPLAKGGEGGFCRNMLQYNKNLKEFSRELRTNVTDAEKLLWTKLRGKQLKGFHFYRQKPLGNFIVDFYCPIPLNPPLIKGD